MKTGNQIAYVFTDVIPGLLIWFADNWRDIFTTLLNFNAAVFKNMAANAGSFFSALWGAIKGEGFDFEWTPLTEGFENTIKQLPAIAERQVGPIEQALQNQADALRGSFADGLADHLAKQQKAVEGTTDAIVNAVNAAGDTVAAPAIEPPVIPAAKLDIDADTSELEEVGNAAKESSAQLQAMFAGSAEALQASAAAAFAARIEPTVKATATGAAGAASADIAATPSAAPVSPDAARSIRESAEEKKLEQLRALDEARNGKLDRMVEALQQLVTGGGSLAPAEF